jgi:hypothetical protein
MDAANSLADTRLWKNTGPVEPHELWTQAGLEKALGGRLPWETFPPRIAMFCAIQGYLSKVDPVAVLGTLMAAASSRMGPNCHVKSNGYEVRSVCHLKLCTSVPCLLGIFSHFLQNPTCANVVLVAPSGSGKSRVVNLVRNALLAQVEPDRARLGKDFTPVFTNGTVAGLTQSLGKNKGMLMLMSDEYFAGIGAHQIAPSSSVDRQKLTSLLSGDSAQVAAFASKQTDDVFNAAMCSASTTQPIAYQKNVLAASSLSVVEDGFLQRLTLLPCVAMEYTPSMSGEDVDAEGQVGVRCFVPSIIVTRVDVLVVLLRTMGLMYLTWSNSKNCCHLCFATFLMRSLCLRTLTASQDGNTLSSS